VLKKSKWKIGKNCLSIGDAHRVGKMHEAVNETYWSISSLLANYQYS
jgi:hypothetical protein